MSCRRVIKAVLSEIGDEPINKYIRRQSKNSMEYGDKSSTLKLLFNKYGDMPIKNFFTNEVIDNAWYNVYDNYSYMFDTINKSGDLKGVPSTIVGRSILGRMVVRDYFNSKIFKNANIDSEAIQKLKQQGFDAMLDLEDSSMADAPLIIFDPHKKMKRKDFSTYV